MNDLVLTKTQFMPWFGNEFNDYCKQHGKITVAWIPVGAEEGTLVVFLKRGQPSVPRKIRRDILERGANIIVLRVKKAARHKRYTVFFKNLPPFIKLKTNEGSEQDFFSFVAFKTYLFTNYSSVFLSGLVSDIGGKTFPVVNIRCHPDVVHFLKGLDLVDSVIEDTVLDDPTGEIKKGFLDTYCETGSDGFHWIITEYVHRQNPYEDEVHLKDGDVLTVLNDDDSVVWQGVIEYDWKIGYAPYPGNPSCGQQLALGCWVHGIQKGFQPDDWAKLFFQGHNVKSGVRPYRAIVSSASADK